MDRISVERNAGLRKIHITEAALKEAQVTPEKFMVGSTTVEAVCSLPFPNGGSNLISETHSTLGSNPVEIHGGQGSSCINHRSHPGNGPPEILWPVAGQNWGCGGQIMPKLVR